jgi:hypothetical protein
MGAFDLVSPREGLSMILYESLAPGLVLSKSRIRRAFMAEPNYTVPANDLHTAALYNLL